MNCFFLGGGSVFAVYTVYLCVSIIVQLSEPKFAGGDVVFPNAGVRVSPEKVQYKN